MPNIEEIRYKIANNQFELSKHAIDQTISRQIRLQEIREAMESQLHHQEK